MGCGCGGKQWPANTTAEQASEAAQPVGTANPNYTWPPRGNGPAPKKP